MNIFKKKSFYFFALAAIFTLGIFLRSYHFSDWLHFELDQSRDAKIADLAIKEGIGNLPLLGPKAAGSFLRLGPLFYYQEYLSALIFGNTPSGIAALSLILSCLAIPLFYFFVKRYFSAKISLLLSGLFSVSLFMIMYSRFAWNPNNLPFFVILAFYALLKVVDGGEKRKGMWLIIFSGALSFATQLHFVAFLAIPAISAIFLIIKRPRIKIKYWLACLGIVAFLYSPMIINEIKTGGDNSKEFLKIFEKKSSGGGEKTILEKAVKDYSENSLDYFLILSGYSETELPKFSQKEKINIQCGAGCRKYLPFGISAFAVFTGGLLLLLVKSKKIIFGEKTARKDFTLLSLIWFAATFILFLPIAYDIAPRFFLLNAALPFIFLGFILEFFEKKSERRSYYLIITYIFILILVVSNLGAIKKRFNEMRNAPDKSFTTKTDRILKERYRVTLEQQYAIVDYMEKIYNKNKYPVYLNSEAFYRRAFLYHLDKKNIPANDFRNASNSKKIYQNGSYFLIYPSTANLDDRKEEYMFNYDLLETKQFGTLTVFRLYPKKEKINVIQQEFGPKSKPKSASGVPVRCRWNEIFKKCNPDEVINEGDEN